MYKTISIVVLFVHIYKAQEHLTCLKTDDVLTPPPMPLVQKER